MIVSILTYSCAIKTTFTESQLVKYALLERSACATTGTTPVLRIKDCLEIKICSFVESCFQKKIDHPIFNNNFEIMGCEKRTRNNNISLKLPPVKLEIAKKGCYFGGTKLFNNLSVEKRRLVI